MVNEKIRKQVKDDFTEYLTLRKHRKTSERYAILDHIYSIDGHFNMDSLYNSMLEACFRVSRFVLYNTIELLLDCGLVVKHQFGADTAAQYERAYGNEKSRSYYLCRLWRGARNIKQSYQRRPVEEDSKIYSKLL